MSADSLQYLQHYFGYDAFLDNQESTVAAFFLFCGLKILRARDILGMEPKNNEVNSNVRIHCFQRRSQQRHHPE